MDVAIVTTRSDTSISICENAQLTAYQPGLWQTSVALMQLFPQALPFTQ